MIECLVDRGGWNGLSVLLTKMGMELLNVLSTEVGGECFVDRGGDGVIECLVDRGGWNGLSVLLTEAWME